MDTTAEWKVYTASGAFLGYSYARDEREALEAWTRGGYAERNK